MDLKLFGVGLLFAHSVLKPGFAVFAHGGDEQKIGLSGGHDPLSINAHVYASDWVPQTWKQGLGVLPNFLVKPDLSIKRPNRESSVKRSRYLVEFWVRFVDF